jgi:NDP-sugar pyrophosphorylase family protein
VGNHFTAHHPLYLAVAVEVGNHANLGASPTIDKCCQFGDNTTTGFSATVGNYCKFGNNTKIGPTSNLGDNVTVGNNCEIGANSTIGRNFQHGANLTLEGVLVRRFLTMANVDGSGRSILIVVHPDGILVRAGCFVGSLNKFCLQAEYQSKHVYSAVVRAAAEALEKTC